MEFWDGYERALDPIVAYNHGIGGTTAAQWRDALLERLVVPYRPKAVVYYVGVNDLINGGLSVETVAGNVEELMGKTHERLPEAHLFFVYINVLPGYNVGYADSIRKTNSNVAAYIEGKSWIEGVAAGEALQKENGEASAAYFRADSMHMSEYGYVLWGARIKKALKNWLG
jgi:lysophospholipase L1-like esterase